MASGDAEGLTLDEYAEALSAALPAEAGGPRSPTVIVLPDDAGLRSYVSRGYRSLALPSA